MAHSTSRIPVRSIGAVAVLAFGMSVGTLGTATSALAATAGDKNAGDVWVDNVGQPAGPGHEQDPHLACTNINLWGAGLADASGSYHIDGWSPSGSQETVYSSTWHYNGAKGGTQVLSVINVQQLVSAARAAGDAPVNKQGLHFKLQFDQDPQKHKTFWVDCTSTTPYPYGS